MIAGGVGAVSDAHVHKIAFPAGTLLIQLGGEGMRIGMGGGAASSMTTGQNTAILTSTRCSAVTRDGAARAGSHQRVLAAARCQSDPPSTTLVRAACRTRCPSWYMARAMRAIRAAHCSTCAKC